jgi:hypothetical protein
VLAAAFGFEPPPLPTPTPISTTSPRTRNGTRTSPAPPGQSLPARHQAPPRRARASTTRPGNKQSPSRTRPCC